jgi:predicted flap endonuclease-1-like 5' DNA nuclease
MKYILTNTSSGALQINLHDPNPSYNKKNLNRPGPVVALNIPRGQSIDILPYFNNDIVKAHACMKFSRDTLTFVKPHMLHVRVCNDKNEVVDIDVLLGTEKFVEKPKVKEIPKIIEIPKVAEVEMVKATIKPEESYTPPVNKDDIEKITKLVEAEPINMAKFLRADGEVPHNTNKEPDDLRKIKYVGSIVSQKLLDSGLDTYAKIAATDIDMLTGIVGQKALEIKKQAEELCSK